MHLVLCALAQVAGIGSTNSLHLTGAKIEILIFIIFFEITPIFRKHAPFLLNINRSFGTKTIDLNINLNKSNEFDKFSKQVSFKKWSVLKHNKTVGIPVDALHFSGQHRTESLFCNSSAINSNILVVDVKACG